MFFRHNFLTVGSFPRILFDSESCGPELSANITLSMFNLLSFQPFLGYLRRKYRLTYTFFILCVSDRAGSFLCPTIDRNAHRAP